MSERLRRRREETQEARRTDESNREVPAAAFDSAAAQNRQGLPGRNMGGYPAGMAGGLPGQKPGMAAGGMPGQAPEREMRAVRTGSEEEAYNLGARMGAQSLASAAGGMGAGTGTRPAGMTKDRLIEAERLLMEYKRGKASVERRIVSAQQWWKMRNWEEIENDRGTRGATERKSNTAWLWNCIVGKHADAMDSYPEPVILPRMQEDKAQAQILSDIIPVVLRMNDFERQYSDAQWQKMQEGTAGYHIGWDKTKLGGLGDISVKNISLLNLYWEPGIEDIQESENLFYVQLVDTRRLEQQHPELKDKLKNAYLKPTEYRKDDSVSVEGKCVLVDWYYHVWDGERKVLHYCQFVNQEILYSTENNGDGRGLYDDGEYPFVLDPLYPVHGSPAGYGYIDIAKDAQTDIDTLNQAMVQNAVVTSTPRYFIQSDGAINEDEFSDWSRPFVHTGGSLGETSIRQIVTSGIQTTALNMLEQKIDELKFVTGNNDVNNGGTPSGVTAASAIAALQEMSGRSSKDSTRAAYRSYNQIITMVIERIRQFYDIPRQFRIIGQNGEEKYIAYSNAQLVDQQLMGGLNMPEGYRRPVFDIEVRSQRENAYTKMSQNELAIQFMQLGVFNPQMTDQSLMMLDMMDFKGKDQITEKVKDNGTLMDAMLRVGQIAMALAEKYEPQIAAELGAVLGSIGMDVQGAESLSRVAGNGRAKLGVADNASDKPSNETAMVRRSREQVNNSARPE